MNRKQACVASTIAAVALGAPFVGRLARNAFLGEGAPEQISSKSALPAGDISRPDGPEDNRNQANELAVLGVVGRTFDAMRDQASMTITSIGIVRAPKSMTACLVYASKNGFGGMNRGYSVWYLSDTKVFRFSIDDAGHWNTRCADKQLVDYTDTGRDLLQKMKAKGGS